ncbi:MAG: DUF4038 domain-containing protein [Gammaproteobacteria bacterium]|nr:DUF4038 domain-containing protein [Gammaproteobacteria bacterium]
MDATKSEWRSTLGFGHQYGNNNVWQFYDPAQFAPRSNANAHWETAVNSAGADQMQHLRDLIESRPFFVRTPDQNVLNSTAEQGGSHTRLQASRASDGGYAFVYSTNGRAFDVDLSTVSGVTADAWWFDPETGAAMSIGSFSTTGIENFDPPGAPSSETSSDGNDWVLVLDDASRGFGPPGSGNGGGPQNQAPTVDAGANQSIALSQVATLNGTVDDDGQPSGALTILWTQVSGSGTASFGDSGSEDTTASFSAAGTYVLGLSADDGELSSSDEVQVTVTEPGGAPFGTPPNFTATVISGTQIDLSWTDVEGETGYTIRWLLDGGGRRNFNVGANTTIFSHVGLEPNTSYRYRIRANRSSGQGGNSSWSSSITATTGSN